MRPSGCRPSVTEGPSVASRSAGRYLEPHRCRERDGRPREGQRDGAAIWIRSAAPRVAPLLLLGWDPPGPAAECRQEPPRELKCRLMAIRSFAGRLPTGMSGGLEWLSKTRNEIGRAH